MSLGRLEIKSEDKVAGQLSSEIPNVTFQHDDAIWAGVVIEVAYSQSSKDIPNLADNYITTRSIHVVLGLDIGYNTIQKKGP